MNEQPVSEILFKGDWGDFPNKQFAKSDRWAIEKMSKAVQIYTACEFDCIK